MLKKGFCILLILLIVLLLSGCYQECEGLKCTIYSGKKPEITKPYSKETMLELIDNLDCNGHLDIYDYDKFGVIGYTKINPNAKEPIINCNLKNNYIFDDEVSYKDQNGDEVRKITLLLKKYNIYFEIITKWGCISDDRYGVFGCSESGYIITTNYFSKILNYLQNQYDSQANSKICSFWNKNVCYVTSEADIAEVATYYEGLKEYLNNLHLDINFQKTSYPLYADFGNSLVDNFGVTLRNDDGKYKFINYLKDEEIDNLYNHLLKYYKEKIKYNK